MPMIFAVTTRALGGVVFFLLTAPISAHLLAKAAHASGLALWQHVGFGRLCNGRTAEGQRVPLRCARRARSTGALFHGFSESSLRVTDAEYSALALVNYT